MKIRIIGIALGFMLVDHASAQEHAFGARVGMLGAGIEYAYPIGERFAVRGGINGAGYSFDETESDIDYEFDLEWDSLSVALDFHPTRGPLRLTAGILKNDNSLSAISSLTDDATVGGVTYTSAEVGTLRADMGFDDTATFLGLGWDWSRNKRFGVALDLGVVNQGSPRVALTADGDLAGMLDFEDDLAAEEAELQAALEDLDLVPFATLGVVFRF